MKHSNSFIETQLLELKQRLANENLNKIDQNSDLDQAIEADLLKLSEMDLSDIESKAENWFEMVQENEMIEEAGQMLDQADFDMNVSILNELKQLSDQDLSKIEARETAWYELVQTEEMLDQISLDIDSIDPSDYPKFYREGELLGAITAISPHETQMNQQSKTIRPFPIKSSMLTLAAISLMLFFSTTGFQAPLVEEAVAHHQFDRLPTDVSSDEPKEIVDVLNAQLPFKIVLPTLKAKAKLLGARMTRVTTGQDVMKDAVYLVYANGKTKLSLLVYQDEHLDMNYQDFENIKGKEYFFHQVEGQKETVVGFQGDGLIYLLTSTLTKEKMIELF
jgi:hypothetical protein